MAYVVGFQRITKNQVIEASMLGMVQKNGDFCWLLESTKYVASKCFTFHFKPAIKTVFSSHPVDPLLDARGHRAVSSQVVLAESRLQVVNKVRSDVHHLPMGSVNGESTPDFSDGTGHVR